MKIPLKNRSGQVMAEAIVDDADYAEVSRVKWSLAPSGYATGWMANRVHGYMHRLIARTPPGMSTDHINCDKLDNRRCNLRICTQSQNMANTTPPANNKSGIKGVSWDKARKKWAVYLKHKRICMNIGRFDSLDDARAAYEVAASVYFGKFAKVSEAT